MTHICVSKLTIIGLDNGLSPDRRQAIIWTNVGLLLIGPLGTNFSEILIEILTFSFKKMRLKVSSAKRRSFCLGLNVLTYVVNLRTGFCLTQTGATSYALKCDMPWNVDLWKIKWLNIPFDTFVNILCNITSQSTLDDDKTLTIIWVQNGR